MPFSAPVTRGLLLRGVGGSGKAVALPFAQGVSGRTFALPYTQLGPLAGSERTLPYWQQGPSGIESLLPFTQAGPLGLEADLPFAILDDSTGVDSSGGIVAPLMGWYEEPASTARSYVEVARSTPGVRGYWRLGEPSGTAAADHLGISPGTYTGTVTLAQPGALTSDPDTAALFAGGYVALTDPAVLLHPADAFALAFWFRRTAAGALHTVWSAGTGDLQVGFTAANTLRIRREATADIWVSTGTHGAGVLTHALVWKNGAAAGACINGVAVPGTFTNQTLVASATAPRIGLLTSGTEAFAGLLDEVTLFDAPADPAALAASLWAAGRG